MNSAEMIQKCHSLLCANQPGYYDVHYKSTTTTHEYLNKMRISGWKEGYIHVDKSRYLPTSLLLVVQVSLQRGFSVWRDGRWCGDYETYEEMVRAHPSTKFLNLLESSISR